MPHIKLKGLFLIVLFVTALVDRALCQPDAIGEEVADEGGSWCLAKKGVRAKGKRHGPKNGPCVTQNPVSKPAEPPAAHEPPLPAPKPRRNQRKARQSKKERLPPVCPSAAESSDAPSSVSLKLEDFEKLDSLGEGTYGSVFLARHTPTGELYAIKVVDKPKDCLDLADYQYRALTNELNAAKVESPFVINLFAAFQDDEKVYFVEQYAPGGDLSELLLRQRSKVLAPS